MIEFLVDTDWAADYLKGKEDAVQLLSPRHSAGTAGDIDHLLRWTLGGRPGFATPRGAQVGVGGH
jgi:hypothetical protein